MLAIEWTNKQLRVVEGQAAGESVRLNTAFELDIPEAIDAGNPEALGLFIRTKLSEGGIKEKRAVSCIDRRSVVLKVISVANIAEAEIPGVVRFQAMRDLTLPIEETIVDYLRTGALSDIEEPQAVLAVVRTEIVSNHEAVFRAAGLKLEGIWPASLAHVRAAITASPTMITHVGEEHFLIVPHGDSVELSLLRGTQFLTSASRPVARAQADTPASEPLLQTIKRLQASLSGQYSDLKVQSVLFAGEESDAELTQALREQFGVEIVYFDPLRTLANRDIVSAERGAFAGVVGSLVVADRPADQKINFLTPKKPVRQIDRRWILAGAAVASVLAAAFFLFQRQWEQLRVLEDDIQAAKDRQRVVKKELETLKSSREQLEAVTAWGENQVVWLDVLHDLWTRMPKSSELFLNNISLRRGSGGGPKGILKLTGFAKDEMAIQRANETLAQELKWRIEGGERKPESRFPGYGWQYSPTIEIPPEYVGGIVRSSDDAVPREETAPASSTLRETGDDRDE